MYTENLVEKWLNSNSHSFYNSLLITIIKSYLHLQYNLILYLFHEDCRQTIAISDFRHIFNMSLITV